MKKIFAILSILGTIFYASAVRAAENPFLSPDWWKIATPETVENAIRNGADVKERNNHGVTPLMLAAGKNEHPEVIETLIKHGADVEAKQKVGATALMICAKFGKSPEVLEALIKAGANVKVKSNEGKTALDYAKDNPHIYRTKAYWLLNDRMYE